MREGCSPELCAALHWAQLTPALSPQRLVESRRQQILKEFEELHRRLDEEQQVLLSRLEEEEQDILQRLRENAALLGDKRRDLAHLAAEVEGKCLQSGFEMLKVRPGSRVRGVALPRAPACSASQSTVQTVDAENLLLHRKVSLVSPITF